MRLAPTPVAPSEFNRETVLRRFMSDVIYADWMKNGRTIVKGAYDWLFIEPELVELVKHEFHMYISPLQKNEQPRQPELVAFYILHTNSANRMTRS